LGTPAQVPPLAAKLLGAWCLKLRDLKPPSKNHKNLLRFKSFIIFLGCQVTSTFSQQFQVCDWVLALVEAARGAHPDESLIVKVSKSGSSELRMPLPTGFHISSEIAQDPFLVIFGDTSSAEAQWLPLNKNTTFCKCDVKAAPADFVKLWDIIRYQALNLGHQVCFPKT